MRPTNKQARKEIELRKYKQRVINYYGLKEYLQKDIKTTHVFKSTGKPCSCYMCSPYKYKRQKFNLNNIENDG